MKFFDRSKSSKRKSASRQQNQSRVDPNLRRDQWASNYIDDNLYQDPSAYDDTPYSAMLNDYRSRSSSPRPTAQDLSDIERSLSQYDQFSDQQSPRSSFTQSGSYSQPVFQHFSSSIDPTYEPARTTAYSNSQYDDEPYSYSDDAERETGSSNQESRLEPASVNKSAAPESETPAISQEAILFPEHAGSKSLPLYLIEHLPFIALIGIALLNVFTIAQTFPLSEVETQVWYLSAYPSDIAAREAIGLNGSSFYTMIVGHVISIFGDAPLSLRAISLVAYGLSIILIYAFGTILITRDIGLVLASLFAFSKFAIDDATQVGASSFLSLLVLSLIFSAIYVHHTTSRLIVLGAIFSSVVILNLTPLGFVIVAAIFVGAFFDATSNLKSQFMRFSVWGLGQGIAIILFWPWTLQNFGFDRFSWLSLGEALTTAPERLTDIAAVMSFSSYYLIPIGLGLILSLRTLVQPTPFNTEKPVTIGGILFLSILVPLCFALLLSPTDNLNVDAALLISSLSSLVILSGIGLAYLSTRVPFHASFFVALFVLVGFTNSAPPSAPTIDLATALQQYNSIKPSSGCVVVFPERFKYETLYGIEERPSCIFSSNQESDVTPQAINNQGATMFFFPKAQGDGSSLRKIIQNFPLSEWQVQPQSFSGVLIITLIRKSP